VKTRSGGTASISSGAYDPEICPNPLLGRAESFRWLRRDFEVALEPGAPGGGRTLRLDLESVMPLGEQFLSVAGAAGPIGNGLWLSAGRRVYALRLPEGSGRLLRFELNRTVTDGIKAGDSRELGVKLHAIELTHEDEAWSAPYPQVLVVEPTSRCNYACLICRHANRGANRPADWPEEWTELLRPLAAHFLALRLQGGGEPLLARSLPRLIRLAPPSRPVVVFSSNMSVLTEEMENLIFGGQVREVSVSLDAGTPDTYRLIRGGEILPVLANIESIIARRRHLDSQLPRITLSMTLMRMNVHEAPAFVRLAHGLGVDGVIFRQLRDDHFHGWTVERDGFRFVYDEQLLKHAPEQSDELLAEALSLARALGVQVKGTPNRTVFLRAKTRAQPEAAPGAGNPAGQSRSIEPRDCPFPWRELLFKTDGSASFCCWQLTPGLPNLGEVAHVDEIWHSPAARRFRAELAANRLPEACRGAVCRFARPGGASISGRAAHG
jgi:MoaA/NifB/PqqE/SkfB family radical SAM enzyme